MFICKIRTYNVSLGHAEINQWLPTHLKKQKRNSTKF